MDITGGLGLVVDAAGLALGDTRAFAGVVLHDRIGVLVHLDAGTRRLLPTAGQYAQVVDVVARQSQARLILHEDRRPVAVVHFAPALRDVVVPDHHPAGMIRHAGSVDPEPAANPETLDDEVALVMRGDRGIPAVGRLTGGTVLQQRRMSRIVLDRDRRRGGAAVFECESAGLAGITAWVG